MSDAPYLSTDDGSVIVRIPTGPFMDWELRDSRIGPQHSEIGTLCARTWTETEIARYHEALQRWESWGEPLARVIQNVFGRRIRGGLVGRACRRIGVPLRSPPDRAAFIVNNVFDWPPSERSA